jgi:glycosyltransferase involved in cell wall biosynthesis
VQVEYHVMAQYLSALDGCAAPRVLVEHEPGAATMHALARLERGYSGVVARLDALAWTRFERSILRRVQAVVTFTKRDQRALEMLGGNAPILTIPLGTDCPPRALDPLGVPPPTLLFVGSYIHPPNVDAALRLAGTIFPLLQARCPGVRLQIVGQRPPPEVRRLSGPGVEVTGWVPDVTPYLDRAALVVAPLRRGGGMRIKVLEALAAGKALVASRLAVEGLDVTDGEQCILADSDQECVAAIQRLLGDAELRAAVATRARRWALANLRWERTVADYEALYARLLETAG